MASEGASSETLSRHPPKKGRGPDEACPPSAPCHAYNALAFAFIGHNIEELMGLPGWLARQDFPIAITSTQFAEAIAWLTIGAIAVLLVARMVPHRVVQIAAGVVTGMLLANVVSHVGLSLATLSYMPGTGTALALVLPAGLWLSRRLPLPIRSLWISLGAGAVLMLPTLWVALLLTA